MPANIFSDIPEDLPDEMMDVLAKKGNVKIERIVSRGHVSDDWYDQANDEFVLLIQGEAKLKFEVGEKTIHLQEGDYLRIPAHQRHKVAWTLPDADTIWLAVHY